MKKVIKRLIVLVLAIIFCSYQIIVEANSKPNTVAGLRSAINELKAQKSSNDDKKHQTQSEINASSQSINNAKTEINDNQEKIEQAKKEGTLIELEAEEAVSRKIIITKPLGENRSSKNTLIAILGFTVLSIVSLGLKRKNTKGKE